MDCITPSLSVKALTSKDNCGTELMQKLSRKSLNMDSIEISVEHQVRRRLLCLCNPLCFLVSRFGKRSSKELKSAVLDCYNFEELSCAKNQLIEDVKGLETSVNLPHIPTRRGGEDRVIHIVDDIFTVLTYLDESLSLGMLPRYVTDNLDSVPSSRLYDGDLSTLMKVIERMVT